MVDSVVDKSQLIMQGYVQNIDKNTDLIITRFISLAAIPPRQNKNGNPAQNRYQGRTTLVGS